MARRTVRVGAQFNAARVDVRGGGRRLGAARPRRKVQSVVREALDVRCDPNVPPIPPHATFEQAEALGSALVGGDDDAGSVVKRGTKQKVQQYLPGTKS